MLSTCCRWLLLVVLAVLKMPPFLSILGSALFAAVLAPFLQWDAVVAFVDDPSLGNVATGMKAGYAAMATGFVSDSGVPEIDDLFSRGGMASMLTTIWLVLGALSFAAVMEHAGFLQRLLEPIVSRTRRRGSLIAAVNGSGIGLNVIAGDQYVADVLPGADVPQGVRPPRPGATGAVPGGGGLRHGHLRPGAVEHLRRRTSRACSGSRPLPTSRTASSTCSARCWTSCTASSASRCLRQRGPGRTTR